MDLKVAALYMPEIHVGEPDKNRKLLERAIRDCYDAHPDIDLAVAPELANVGFHLIECEYWKRYGQHKSTFEIQKTKGDEFIEEVANTTITNCLELIPDGKTTALLQKLAAEYNTHFVCGIGETDVHRTRYNSAVFIGPEGYVRTYRQEEKTGIINPWTTGYGETTQRKIFTLTQTRTKVGIVICVEMVTGVPDTIAPAVSILAVPANWYEDSEGNFGAALQRFDKQYQVPLIVGNRGQELFGSEPHTNEYASPSASTGHCAIISIPGKRTIKKEGTIVETITL